MSNLRVGTAICDKGVGRRRVWTHRDTARSGYSPDAIINFGIVSVADQIPTQSRQVSHHDTRLRRSEPSDVRHAEAAKRRRSDHVEHDIHDRAKVRSVGVSELPIAGNIAGGRRRSHRDKQIGDCGRRGVGNSDNRRGAHEVAADEREGIPITPCAGAGVEHAPDFVKRLSRSEHSSIWNSHICDQCRVVCTG